MSPTAPAMIVVERTGRVALVRLHRPQALNALNDQLMRELGDQLAALDADPAVGVVVLTGSDRAFAAGADIREMQARSLPMEDFVAPNWEAVTRVKKPVIAAVAGFALGGGCELALMCDIVFAAESAKFGQPEVTLGIIPGGRRHPAAGPRGGQGEGDGAGADRADDRRRRGRALWSGGAGVPGGGDA